MTELPNAGHELEVRRWVRTLRGRRSLCFAVGAGGLEAVLGRARELAPEARIERVEVEPATAWGVAQRALAELPEGGALVLDLRRNADGSAWSARDWLGLNLARDAPERANRHLLVWVRGFDGLDALRDGAPDLWMHRSLLLMFPSAADFVVPEGGGRSVRDELKAELARPGGAEPGRLMNMLALLAEVAWNEPGVAWWGSIFARLVARTWILHPITRINWLEVLAIRLGGRPLVNAMRRYEEQAPGYPLEVTDRQTYAALAASPDPISAENRRHRANLCASGLAYDRPSLTKRWLEGEPVETVFDSVERRMIAHSAGLLAVAHLRRLDAIDALIAAKLSLQHYLEMGLLASNWPAATAARTYAALGLPVDARVTLAHVADLAADPWEPLLWEAELDTSAAPHLRSVVNARTSVPAAGRTAAYERVRGARLLRTLSARVDRERGLALLSNASDPRRRIPFVCTKQELNALDPASPDPIEAALAYIRDADDSPRDLPTLETLTYDPIADLRIDALELRAALLRELGRPAEALIAIEQALAAPDRTVREIANAELECARVRAALGDSAAALAHLDRVESVLESERDETIDVRPLGTLVGAAVIRSRLLGDAAPIHAAIALCEAEENRALVFELQLELAALEPLGQDARRAAARSALLLASETGFIVLEARAAAWCARLGGDDAPALRERAEWIAARCPDRRLALAMVGERVPEP